MVSSLLATRARHRRDGPAEIRIQKVKYSFDQLQSWYDQVVSVLTVPGVVFTDIRESRNRIEVGVETLAAMNTVTEFLRGLKLPDGAFAVSMASAVTPENKYLWEAQSPMMPAFRITTFSYCSSAANVKLPGDTALYLLTASHCTPQLGQFDGTSWWQAGTLLGTEAYDASYFYCGTGRPCLNADAALLRYNSASDGWFARIAKPTQWRLPVVDEQNPLVVEGEEPLVFEGDWVEKLGYADGYSYGEVWYACVTVNLKAKPPHPAYTVLCANNAAYWSFEGDSGGAVFNSGFPWYPATTSAIFYGVNFARNDNGAGYFSGIAQIELAYGNILTF